MATNLSTYNPARLIVSIAYDPPRVADILDGSNEPGSPITVFRSVLLESQKVLQYSSLPLSSNI